MRIKPLFNQWIDLSHLIESETIVYPGDPQFEIHPLHDHAQDGFHMDAITSAMHVGTHLDSPFHFIENGKTVDEIELSKVLGNASCIKVTPISGVLKTDDIQSTYQCLKHPHAILLISTGHSRLFNSSAYFSECPAFEPSFFAFVKQANLKCIGLDLPTIQYYHESPMQAHLDVLGNEIIVIEGLNHLEQLSEEVFFSGLSLKIKGLDGSLIRAVAQDIDTNSF